jgi:hypothetical protein
LFSGSGIVGQSNGQLRFHVHAERAFSGKVAEVLQVREVRVEAPSARPAERLV